MNSSFASSSFSNLRYPSYSSSSSSSSMEVTTEEFNAFHTIDRTLFTRLVFGLKRDITQSLDVFAFLYLLEQAGYVRDLIAYLVTVPDASINKVADEVVVCLTFLFNKDYATTFFIASNNSDGQAIIPLIIRMTGGKINLLYIHQKREAFLVGVSKHLNEFCIRAFGDICLRAENYYKEQALALERAKLIEDMKKIRLSNNRRSVQLERVRAPLPPRRIEVAKNKTKEEVKKKEKEEAVLAPDERTVFLTFSKGYPISEEEVRAYFTGRFGEVIEAIKMQEVEENEQPLYARMVLKMFYAWKMEEIVTRENRNMFTIDGKHVLAHKYVSQNLTSASSSSSSSS